MSKGGKGAFDLSLDKARALALTPVSRETEERLDRYVELHLQSNPSVDRVEFAHRLRQAVDARKAGARCACVALIWAIGSAEAGAACFTCITGEAWPENDYEIDEAPGLSPG